MTEVVKPTPAADLQKSLLSKKESAHDVFNKAGLPAWFDAFMGEYREFLSVNKTERESVSSIEKIAHVQGFEYRGDPEGIAFPCGFRGHFMMTNKDKNIALVKCGTEDPRKGVKIIMSHLDSPRLDLKGSPLYEDTEFALLKTHYYGGIKNYQWVTRPLALHGVVFLKDGTKITLKVGESPTDPVFFISDILPHLSYKVQDSKTANEIITGEQLNLIIGTEPYTTDEELSGKIKLNILKILNDKYGMVEDDFLSAELEVVPAGSAREIGFDRSMIGGYGQDDRVCAFTSMQALFDSKSKYTQVVLFVDKEEIGSDGNTGAKSLFIKKVIRQVFKEQSMHIDSASIDECLANSWALSADVTGAFDPSWPEVNDAKNATYMSHGVCVHKFGGSGGKYSSSDANAEYVSKIRRLLEKNNIPWQAGELGKVDEGGGGTIAKYLAEYGMEVIDMGPPLLSMHSPFEVVSKADVWATYLAYKAFLESN